MVIRSDEAGRRQWRQVTDGSGRLVLRHRLATRLWHWVNALAVIVLLMSGLMIFNAHPRLYWGEYGANFDPAWLEIGARGDRGFLRLGTLELPTSGVLGAWRDGSGAVQHRAFPGWATIPGQYSLADARLWHLAFAWLLAVAFLLFLAASIANRHLARDLLPRRAELRFGHLWADIRRHARLRFPRGEAALEYSILQKLAYGAVVFLLLPLAILSGLAMSPAVDAAWPLLVDLFAGRQSARSFHFIAAALLLAFLVVHLAMVLLAGPLVLIRSMIGGRYRLPAAQDQA